MENRSTGSGPHKDDLKIAADDIDLRKFGSQGQQRTAALSLKLFGNKAHRGRNGREDPYCFWMTS